MQEAPCQPLFVYLNSMVILGQEPLILDTGTIANREQWLEDGFSLVDPEDVKWVFVSHDNVDHTGNLEQTMEACPNATLVYNWSMHERQPNAFEFPLERARWLMDGETLDIGDRTLVAPSPRRCPIRPRRSRTSRPTSGSAGSRFSPTARSACGCRWWTR